MEHATGSSSSKVAVEYTDPSNLYQSISQELSRRLPLKNLHWNSSSRPLRSIKSLHIELIPDDKKPSHPSSLGGSHSSTQNGELGQGFTEQATTGGRPVPFTADSSTKKERRHQIPGLRKTPYLKIYILRCDNVDTYKSSSRKLLREWVKDHTPPSQKSNKYNTQENHDAFEWLILHIVPTTTSSYSQSGSGDSKESRWSKRGSSNLIEKIRTDFNGTSKNAVDRVAQIYFMGDTTGQSSEDGDTGWGDLIFKLKSLILASFDLRVRQYEEDIKEKESQRNLPGWNFNTFFVLKEGLAKGFESVGLIEDALTSYHELAAGLQSILEGRCAEGSNKADTAQFQDYTDDLLTVVTDILEVGTHEAKLSNGEKQPDTDHDHISSSIDLGSRVLDTNRKAFRELILANQISAFDFQCYIFARQAALLLKIGNAVSPVLETAEEKPAPESSGDLSFSAHSHEPENLLVLADVCLRGMEFITSACRTMRNELQAILNKSIDGEKKIAVVPPPTQGIIVENMTSSWTYSAAECLLSRTSTQSISTQLQPLIRQLNPRQDSRRQGKGIPSSPELPRRTSSLSPSANVLQRPPSPEKYPSVTSLDAMRLLPPHSLQSGAQELASDRATLHSLQRRALSNLGISKAGWKSGWPDMHLTSAPGDRHMEEVSLDDAPGQDDTVDHDLHEEQALPSMSGVRNEELRAALSSEESFYAAYEHLTALTLALYVLGDRKKSAEALTADLAAVRFHLKDYAAAASYFRQLAPFYAQGQWSDVELIMLDLYAQCLEKLNRDEEYVNILLKIVAKQVEGARRSCDSAHQVSSTDPSEGSSPRLRSLLAASRRLEKAVMAPMDRYFDDLMFDPHIRHDDTKDVFSFSVGIRQQLLRILDLDEIRVRLTGMGEEQNTEIILISRNAILDARDRTKIAVTSKAIIPGLYKLDKVSLRSSNIVFHHDFADPVSTIFPASSTPNLDSNPRSYIPTSSVHVYTRSTALNARIFHSKTIHLEKPRSIEVDISTGWNQISHCRILVKAGTGGLRLHTGDAILASGDVHITAKSQPGVIEIGEVSSNREIRIRIPYSVETDLKEIMVKLEISYTTNHGDFVFACSSNIPISLAVGVNVQDIFKREALFSKFSICTASSVPMHLLYCQLEGTPIFEVSSPPLTGNELVIFARQPVTLMTKICRKQDGSHETTKQSRRLFLHVDYVCLDEEVPSVVEDAFKASLADSDFKNFTRLLTPHILTALRSRLTVQKYETIGLLDEIDVGSFADYNWPSILTALPQQLRQNLLNWLSSWHAANPTLALPSSSLSATTPPSSRVQHLTIPVEIPNLQILHTAILRPLTTTPHIALDQTLAAELIISHTRRWATNADTAPDKLINFVYEITAPPETWLIGGQRKAHFSAAEDESIRFGLILLPQTTGHLLFPSLDIRVVGGRGEERDGEDDEEMEGRGAEAMSCETDYISQAETVHVIADLESTTVGLDGGGEGAWVLETRGRGGDR